MPFRSGFVAIIGRPNAGKSTLLNRLVGQKIAIVTHKAQTTRNRIVGVVNVAAKKGKHPAAQIVLVDTPGVHKPGSPMERRMMQEVYDAVGEHSLVLLIVDAKRTFDEGDEYVLELLKRANAKAVLLLNKIDLIAKDKLLPLIDFYRGKYEFKDIVPISAEKGQGVQELVDELVGLLPEGPRYFPQDQVTDQPERFIAAEMIREKVLMLTGQEVPYSSAVMVERWEVPKKKGAATRIAAAIFVEREGQKAIIIGKGGSMLKKIGTNARIELEKMIGNKVFLELFVKVRENWRESRQFLNELDWRMQLEALGAFRGHTQEDGE
ncbi:MAG TPA: GTPase Era [Terriglobales bacterium]